MEESVCDAYGFPYLPSNVYEVSDTKQVVKGGKPIEQMWICVYLDLGLCEFANLYYRYSFAQSQQIKFIINNA